MSSLTYRAANFPWDPIATSQLVCTKWVEIRQDLKISERQYSTSKLLEKTGSTGQHNLVLFRHSMGRIVQLEGSDTAAPRTFCTENHLEPYSQAETCRIDGLSRVRRALTWMQAVEYTILPVVTVTRSIHLLKPPSCDIDTSYSHPDVPFSIFVSIPWTPQVNEEIRLAESILHEAMHLVLSLKEEATDFVCPPKRHEMFYSPWRGEMRPVSGVLHGLFVFRAIYEFFRRFPPNELSEQLRGHLEGRMAELHAQFRQVSSFAKHTALTAPGRALAKQLLNGL